MVDLLPSGGKSVLRLYRYHPHESLHSIVQYEKVHATGQALFLWPLGEANVTRSRYGILGLLCSPVSTERSTSSCFLLGVDLRHLWSGDKLQTPDRPEITRSGSRTPLPTRRACLETRWTLGEEWCSGYETLIHFATVIQNVWEYLRPSLQWIGSQIDEGDAYS